MQHFGPLHVFEAGLVSDLCFIGDKERNPRIAYWYLGNPYSRELIPTVDSVTVKDALPATYDDLKKGSSFSVWQLFSDYGLIAWSSARRGAGVVMPVWGFGELTDDKVLDIIRRAGC